jgi:hypothetical protein
MKDNKFEKATQIIKFKKKIMSVFKSKNKKFYLK